MFCYGNYIEESAMLSLMAQHQLNQTCFMGYKNTDLAIENLTKSTANLFHFKEPEHAFGIKDDEIDSPSVALAPDYIYQDKKVLEGKKVSILDLLPHPEGRLIGFTQRIPVVNHEHAVIGSAFFSTQIQGSHPLLRLLDILTKISGKPGVSLILHEANIVLSDKQYDNLNPKEIEILWLLSRGLSTKKIAAFLFRSPRTIEDHIEHLKIKYQCHSKSELIEKAIHLGILNYLPAGFINTKTIALL